MNRRDFLRAAVLAPAVLPALVETLGAVKPFYAAPLVDQIKDTQLNENVNCTILTEYTRYGKNWVMTAMSCNGTPIDIPEPAPAFVVFDESSSWVFDVETGGKPLTLDAIERSFKSSSDVPRLAWRPRPNRNEILPRLGTKFPATGTPPNPERDRG